MFVCKFTGVTNGLREGENMKLRDWLLVGFFGFVSGLTVIWGIQKCLKDTDGSSYELDDYIDSLNFEEDVDE